jgi:hypothetical protein
VPKDDPESQGLHEDEVEMAAYPDISAEMLGVELKEEKHDFQVFQTTQNRTLQPWPLQPWTMQGLTLTTDFVPLNNYNNNRQQIQTRVIKGRACINGAPQIKYILKEEAASLTVSMESTFITAAIAANRKRKVRCYDVPSAFVNTDVDEDVLMGLKGELADVMVQIAHKFTEST